VIADDSGSVVPLAFDPSVPELHFDVVGSLLAVICVPATTMLSPDSHPVESVVVSEVVVPPVVALANNVLTTFLPPDEPAELNVPPLRTLIPVSPSTVELSVSVALPVDGPAFPMFRH